MILSYLHILKKIFLKNYVTSESDGWLLGGDAFFLFPLYYFLRYFLKCKSFKWFNFNNRSQYLLIFI
jgi:hypothetical protein